jgi:hypothetical protein
MDLIVVVIAEEIVVEMDVIVFVDYRMEAFVLRI